MDRDRKGYALILTLAVMTVLALLATTFVLEVTLAARDAESVIAHERAFLAADSAVQFGLELVRLGDRAWLDDGPHFKKSAWITLAKEGDQRLCFQTFQFAQPVSPAMISGASVLVEGRDCTELDGSLDPRKIKATNSARGDVSLDTMSLQNYVQGH